MRRSRGKEARRVLGCSVKTLGAALLVALWNGRYRGEDSGLQAAPQATRAGCMHTGSDSVSEQGREVRTSARRIFKSLAAVLIVVIPLVAGLQTWSIAETRDHAVSPSGDSVREDCMLTQALLNSQVADGDINFDSGVPDGLEEAVRVCSAHLPAAAEGEAGWNLITERLRAASIALWVAALGGVSSLVASWVVRRD